MCARGKQVPGCGMRAQDGAARVSVVSRESQCVFSFHWLAFVGRNIAAWVCQAGVGSSGRTFRFGRDAERRRGMGTVGPFESQVVLLLGLVCRSMTLSATQRHVAGVNSRRGRCLSDDAWIRYEDYGSDS